MLNYLGGITATREIHEAVILNKNTPDQAIVQLATASTDGSLLELITLNQQRLVRAPRIIDAILQNAARSTEAERRARETQTEFLRKSVVRSRLPANYGRAGRTPLRNFLSRLSLTTIDGELSLEDAWLIAEHIEVSDAELDDSWLPSERYDEAEDPAVLAAAMQKVIEYETMESGSQITPERVSLIRRLMLMNTRDRMKLARKGDREARSILIRDSNKIVAAAVINNPRITDQEAENIATMRTIADEVLRLMAMNRNWARSYTIIHNLARNPRTPIPTVINLLPRIRTKDLQHLAQNRNVSDAIRRQASRLSQARSGE